MEVLHIILSFFMLAEWFAISDLRNLDSSVDEVLMNQELGTFSFAVVLHSQQKKKSV